VRIFGCLIFVFTAVIFFRELGFAESGKPKALQSVKTNRPKESGNKALKNNPRKKTSQAAAQPGAPSKSPAKMIPKTKSQVKAQRQVRPKAPYKEQAASVLGKKKQEVQILDDDEIADQPKNTFSEIPEGDEEDHGAAGAAEAKSSGDEE